MTVWARSDVCAVSLSPGHGGCGVTHSRPVVGGAPVKVWALTCYDGCEDYLRKDALWSGTAHTVPETPDEEDIRKDVEKRGQLEQQAGMAQALNDLAKLGDLPNAIAQLALIMAGDRQKQLSETPVQLCRNGHTNSSSARFCGDCGANMEDAANKKPSAAIAAPKDLPNGGSAVDLESLSMNELRDMASSLGVQTTSSKAKQIDLIKQAQSTDE